MRGKRVMILMLVIVGAAWAAGAFAADYPVKPVEIVTPYTPGGDSDIVARIVADVAAKYFSQPMVVINKPGAGGGIAVGDVIASKPDGYKLFFGAHVYFATTYRQQKVPFDAHDLVPVYNFYELKQGMAVRRDSPFKTLNDLINYAKKHPGELRWCNTGRGISLYLSALLVFKKAGVGTVDIPFKGSPEANAALLGGHVDAGSLPLAPLIDRVRSGEVRYLTVYSEKRYADLPNVPTVGELGFPEAALPTYYGFYMRKDTPDAIKKALSALFRKISEDPDCRNSIEKMGGEPKFGGPDFMMAAIKKHEEIGIPILKELGLLVK